MTAKKTKKFNVGGMLSTTDPVASAPQSLQPFMDGSMSNGSSAGGSATAGLGQLTAGAETVGKAIQSASDALTGSGVQSQGLSSYKSGGKVQRYAKGGAVSQASKRADGCATKGRTKGRMV